MLLLGDVTVSPVHVSASVCLGNLDNGDVSVAGVSNEELWHSGNEMAGLEISNGSQCKNLHTLPVGQHGQD